MGRGWEKVDNPHILGRKYVDKSLLQQGTTIPLYLVESFLENISNNKIPLGTQVNVKIIIENVKYDNNIRNVNRSKVNSDTIQLMFRKKSGILDYLNDKFKYTANLLQENDKVETDEYIDFYKGEEINEFICKLNTHKSSYEYFIDNIKSQKMNKSYKIALLSCFIKDNKIADSVTYDEIFDSLKIYYSNSKHREDLREIKDLELWNKNKYISKMKETAMKYLPKEYFIQDNENEQYSLSDDIKQYIENPEFIQQFKNAIAFLENKYFGEENMKQLKVTSQFKKEIVDNIFKYISSQGYEYSKELISNLYLSLKTKPFVILAGISGTGKSKIVRLFAESLGATVENNQFNMISVRPDWNDSTELIGYKNLESKFIKGKLTQIIEEASQNLDKPYFVCLDEMNLARVEYYLSDYLSVIESRRKVDDKIVTDKLIYDSEIDEEETLSLPENLYIVGTVNMDDTTFQFSRKVLDRANTIEFSEVNLENLFGENSEEDNLDENIEVYNDFLKSTYLKTIDIEDEYRDYAIEINKKIIDINNILKKSQKQFAYRVRDEILFYMIENKKANLLDENEAFDYQIMQKVLPTISGSENLVKETLVNLFNFVCEKEILNDSDIEEAEQFLNSQDIKYKKSAEKIIYMLKGYNYDGYASYWY
ncbi:MAG: McrB family protein [Terrisporobacter sp.]|uniref:McrB family protein n=1 Tax=Terrisporobacter sp. TaxID=1965305 RepID=UPI0039A3AE32